MTPLRITEAEILEALVTASTAPDDARTVPEMSRETGVSEDRLRRALRAIADEGRLQVHRVVRRAIDGRAAAVAAYTVTPRKRAKK
jgi:hypothetical protein